MIKKIKLALEKNKIGKVVRGNIIIPSQFSKILEYDYLDNLNIEYTENKVILSKIILSSENNIEEKIIRATNGTIIYYFGNTALRRSKKKIKDKIYITEKIMLPIEIAKQISDNFTKLNLVIKICENKIIIERG